VNGRSLSLCAASSLPSTNRSLPSAARCPGTKCALQITRSKYILTERSLTSYPISCARIGPSTQLRAYSRKSWLTEVPPSEPSNSDRWNSPVPSHFELPHYDVGDTDEARVFPDDDALLDGPTPQFGEISVHFSSAQAFVPIQDHPGAIGNFKEDYRAHERSKKCVSHCVRYPSSSATRRLWLMPTLGLARRSPVSVEPLFGIWP
jgi:hypothetical protein